MEMEPRTKQVAVRVEAASLLGGEARGALELCVEAKGKRER